METKPRKENFLTVTTSDSDQRVAVIGADNEVQVIPLTAEGEVILLIESSPAFFDEPTLILPGIVVEAVYDEETEEFLEQKGEECGEAANRALQKEIGYTASQLDYLGELRPYATHVWLRSFTYLAQKLEPYQSEDDEIEMLPTERVPLASFEVLIAEGRLLDARIIAALYMARDFLARTK